MAESQQYEIRNKHMLIVAGCLGVVAVIMVMWNEYRVRHENDENMVGVLVARKDLIAGKKVTGDDVEVSRIPWRLVPQEFQGDIVREQDKNSLMDLEMNQEVTSGRIMRFSYCRGGLPRQGSLLVPKVGFRVIGVKVDRESCPPGLFPGMWVDIMVHQTGATRETVPVMQKVLVKTVNGMGTITAGLRNIDSVGLEMRVEDATKLTTFIEIRGARVILWTRNDAEEVKINGFNPELLEGGRSGGGHAERGAP